MRFLARQGGTFPSSPLILASVVLSIIFFASLFQHEAVAGIGESAAQKARDSYQDVKQRIHLLSNNSNNYPPPVTIPPDDPAYLEPEWRFAKDISIVYTVR